MKFRNGSPLSTAKSSRPASPTAAVMIRDEQAARRRQRKGILITWFLAAGLVATMVSQSWGQGQQYDTIPIDPAKEEPDTLKKVEAAAKALSTTSNLADLGRVKGAMASFYYQSYVAAKITHPDAVSKISSLMKNLRDRLDAAGRSNKPGYPYMNRWIYGSLKKVAEGNYQPPARIAAISFISQMDTAPADRSKRTPPVPLRVIPQDFIPIYQDKKAPEGVRAAALQGLHRYVIYAAPTFQGPLRATLITEMQTLLDSDPPAGRNKDVHAYLQRFAVDILASLRAETDADLGKKLVSISTETKNHDLIALHSAARLGSMANDLRGNLDSTSQVLDSWTVRAMRSFQYEIARLNAFDRPKPVSRQPTAADALASIKKDDDKKPKTTRTPMSRGGGMMDDMEMDMGMEMEMEMGMDDMEMDMGMDEMEMGMGMGMGMGAVVQANPQPPEVMVSRRKLNFVLQQLHKGVNGEGTVGIPRTPGGLLAATDEADQQPIRDWLNKMETVITALNEPHLDTLEKYVEALDEQVMALEEIAGPEAVAAAAAIPIVLPGVSRVVATKPAEKNEVPDAPVLDESGAPKFPENLDPLAPPE